MAKIYSKGTWVDEVLAGDALYEVVDDTGTPIPGSVSTLQNTITAVNALLTALANGAKINLVTAVSVAGTPVNAAIMQNIEDGIDDLDTILSLMRSLTTQATAAGTTTLTVASNRIQEFTGTTTETVVMPVVSTLILGDKFTLINNSTGVLTINSSGGNLIASMAADSRLELECVAITGTDETSWDAFSGGGGGSGSIGANSIINGDCSVNQRVTAYTLVKDAYCWDSSDLYGPDMFEGMATGTLVSAGTFGQTTAANCGVSGTAFKFAGVTLTGTGVLYIRYRMEAKDAKKFKNQTASFSCKVYQDSGGAINYTVYVRKADVVDVFSAVTAISNSGAQSIPNIAETSLLYEAVAMGDCSTGIEIEVKVECGAITTKNFEFTEFKFEIGSTATAFEFVEYPLVLNDCMRHAEVIDNSDGSTGNVIPGFADSTSVMQCVYSYKIQKRIAPAASYLSAVGDFSIRYTGTGVTVATVINFVIMTRDHATAYITGTGTALTAGQGCALRFVNTNAKIIFAAPL